jgi:hypothetical protein
MTMDEQAVRAMVREAIAARVPGAGGDRLTGQRPASVTAHVSHVRYVLPESDGPCLIEPTVPCNHCGYCQSHGH